MTIKIGELFAGYGGLGMGVQAVTGGEVAWFSEFDDAPSKILAHHWPDVPNHGDITLIDWSQVEPVDILTGGFPCQDVSLAGARKGLKDGTRSGLWSEFARAIAALKPKLVVIENVRGLLSAEASGPVESDPWGLGNGTDGPALRALGAVLGDLAELGYDAEWCGVRAADAGAPHGRYRIFIIAYANGSARPVSRGIASSSAQGSSAEAFWGVGRGSCTSIEDTYLSTGNQWRQSTPGEEESGRSWADVGGRSGAPAADTHGGQRDGRERETGRRPIRGAIASRSSDQSSSDASSERLGEHPGEPSAEETGTRGCDLADGLSGSRPDTDWGPYLAAVERWELVTGRTAPAPTNGDGRDGGHRLSARFVEWMMGLPAGHVTDAGLTRNQQLKALGNGVVPQQATLAVGYLLRERVAA